MSSANESSTPQKSITRNELFGGSLIRMTPPGSELLTEASWDALTSLGAGSAPFALLRVPSAENAERWIPALTKAGLRIYPLGAGTNFAGSDTKLDNHIFLQLTDDRVSRLPDGRFQAFAGAPLRKLLLCAKENGCSGTAALSGIPGSIGGAVCMNAGACGKTISDFIAELTLLDLNTGKTETAQKSDFPWLYRSSGIGPDKMVLSAVFCFPEGSREEEDALWEQEKQRRAKAPRGRSAGSVFRNPESCFPPAGKLLDDAGAKGMREGAFRVPQEHANWIVNEGGGTASDFRRLVRRMKGAVYQKFGIELHAEIRCPEMDRTVDRVLVVMGGESSEREISLCSGKGVAGALREAGYDVREYDIRKLALTDDMKNWAEVVFPVLHGGYGEDGRFQALLEEAGICYVGPNSAACRDIMDKLRSKELMNEAGISTPAFAILDDPDAPVPEGFEFPLVVKPNSNGSTFGVTLVEDAAQWKAALQEAFRFDNCVFVEEYIKGVEGAIGVVSGRTLPIVEIQFPGKIYDYDAKYNANSKTRHPCPPENMTPRQQEEVAREALAYAKKVGAENLVRIDVIVRAKDGKVFVLEGNGLPGMTPTSLVPTEAKTAGISMTELCSSLVESAVRNRR